MIVETVVGVTLMVLFAVVGAFLLNAKAKEDTFLFMDFNVGEDPVEAIKRNGTTGDEITEGVITRAWSDELFRDAFNDKGFRHRR